MRIRPTKETRQEATYLKREAVQTNRASSQRPGRKPIPKRQVLEAVLWILNTGAQWHMPPQCYANYKTVHGRFQTWCHNEILRRVLTDIANELRERGAIDEEECSIDATFAMAKGGGTEIGPTTRGKGLSERCHLLPLGFGVNETVTFRFVI